MSATGWDQAQRLAKEYGTKFSPRPEPADGANCALMAIPLDKADELVECLEACGCTAYARETRWPEAGRAFVFLLEY